MYITFCCRRLPQNLPNLPSPAPITKMRPANSNVCHIARAAATEHSIAAATEHSIDPPWTTWKEYIANLPTAENIIGPGIVSITAEFIEGTKDPNRRGQPRCDFIVYRADGTLLAHSPWDITEK